MRYASGSEYKGDWVDNQKCGRGMMTWLETAESYEGEWEKDKPHGWGTYYWHTLLPGSQPLGASASLNALQSLAPQLHGINRYEGEFVDGLREGQGSFYYANGARYEGAWLANAKHGDGRFVYEDGTVYEGPFDRDRPLRPTAPHSSHGLVQLNCQDLLDEETDPEARRRSPRLKTFVQERRWRVFGFFCVEAADGFSCACKRFQQRGEWPAACAKLMVRRLKPEARLGGRRRRAAR